MFSANFAECKKIMVMSAELSNIDHADSETRGYLKTNGVSSPYFPALIVMREALSNAIIHGSNNNPESEIRYELEYSESTVMIRITDQGPGFDWRNTSLLPPPPALPHGRGLAIIRQYTNHLEFNESGNQITMTVQINRGDSK